MWSAETISSATSLPSSMILIACMLAPSMQDTETTIFEQSGDELALPLDGVPYEYLLNRLPDISNERTWIEETSEFEYDPVVAELKRRLHAGEPMSSEEWSKALFRSGAIRARQRWPVDRPYAVSMRVPSWLGVSQIRMVPHTDVLASAKVGFLREERCGFASASHYSQALYQELGLLPLGRHSFAFEVIIHRGLVRRYGRAMPPPGLLWQGTMKFDIEIVDELRDAIPATEDERVTNALRSSIGIAFSIWRIDEEWQRAAAFVLEPDAQDLALVASIGLSLQIELLYLDQVVQSTRLAHCYSGRTERYMERVAVLEFLPTSVEGNEVAQENWSLRITGTEEGVLNQWNAKSRWAGQLRIPVADAIRIELDRAGPNSRGILGER